MQTKIMENTELEALVKKHYPGTKEYTFTADQETSENDMREFIIGEECDNWEGFEVFKGGTGYGDGEITREILTDLCDKGIIPKRHYIIKDTGH